MLVVTAATGPQTIPVLGTAVTFAPITRQMMRRARRAALKALARPEDGDDAAAAAPIEEQLEELGDELSFALLLEGILAWGEGVVIEVEEDGEVVSRPLDCTPENKALLLSDPVYFDAFDGAYVVPFATRERAKNGLAGSPNTISGMATPAQIIATPSAAGPSDAKSARTGSTRSKTRKSKKRSTSSPAAQAS
jgi:hypothetical protein